MVNIEKFNFKFLKDIKANNNREWFTANRSIYEKHQVTLVQFADALMDKLNKHDNIEIRTGKKTVIRVYRDVRFSKDKSPYKIYSGMGFRRSSQVLRGGYYLHIEPGNNFVGGGFWNPNKEDLLRIRKGIELDEKEFRAIISSEQFKSVFGELRGSQLKTCPKGFEKDSTAIDFLRYKQFVLTKKFSDEEVMSSNFIKRADDVFRAMRPFLDFMSYVLTTDENGVPLFEE